MPYGRNILKAGALLLAMCALTGALFCSGHHHEDRASHGDCPVCIQLAVGQAGIAAGVCLASATLPRFSVAVSPRIPYLRPNPLLARNYANAPPV